MSNSEGRTLWLQAGQRLLRRGGASSVKLHSLTTELGLTTGSFYHHFASMTDYLEQLASFYGAEQARAVLDSIQHADPRERLRRLAAVARRDDMTTLDAAMRDWSGSNPTAAEAVRRADQLLLKFVESAFIELGFDRRDAQARAILLYSAGVARVSPPWKQNPKLLDAVLEALAPTR
jgi:AcrR family transcriptional regulator